MSLKLLSVPRSDRNLEKSEFIVIFVNINHLLFTLNSSLMRILFLICALFVFLVVRADADDNIILDNRTVNYTLKSQNGKLIAVKIVETSNYLARRADDRMVAVTFYGDGITIDKAQAPDSKPIYRSWEDDDLFYTGSRVCALPISLKKDKPAKVVFERTYQTPEQFCQVMLISPYYTRRAEFTITVPADLGDKISFIPMYFPEGVTLERKDLPNGNIVYSALLENVESYKSEPMSPGVDCSAPQILVKGYFSDVGQLYSFLKDKVDESENSATVAQFARQLCEGKTTEIEKIDTIASWVRNNIRYVAIEHGEYGFRPEPAESVLSKRYGDCKGSANLIRNMLNAVGIDGRLVWIGTKGNVPGKWTDLATLACGNHQIAAAVVGDSLIFIDGTTSFAPKGLVPDNIAGQQCLVLDGDNCLIVNVPENSSGKNYISLNGSTSLDGDKLAGNYSTDYGGEMRMAIETSVNSISQPRRVAALQKLLAYDRQGVRPEDIVMTTSALDAPITTIKHSETDKAAVRTLSGGKMYVQLRPLRAASYPTVDAAKRRLDIAIRHPYDVVSAISFDVPEGMRVETVPERIVISSPWFEGFVDYELADDGRKVLCNARVSCVKTDALASQSEEWNNAVKEIRNASSSPLILVADE